MDESRARFQASVSVWRVLSLWLLVAVVGGMCGLFLLASVLSAKWSVFGVLFIGLGLACSAYLGWFATRLRPLGRPTLRMDDHGLEYAPLGEVPWSEVIGLAQATHELKKGRTARVLMVGVKGPGSVRQSGPARWFSRVQREMAIPLSGLDREPDAVLAAAVALRDDVPPRRLLAWWPGMVEVEIEAGFRRQALQDQMVAVNGTAATDAQRRKAIQRQLDAPDPKARELEAARAGRRRELQWLVRGIVALAILGLLLQCGSLVAALRPH